jgi:hypothetical protein
MNWLPTHFSLTDFLAYFIPGVAGLAATVVLATCTPLDVYVDALECDFCTAAVGVALAYIGGALFSSLDYWYQEWLYKWFDLRRPWHRIPLEGRESQVQEALQRFVPAMASTWTPVHFFTARTLVRLDRPALIPVVDRQNALSQLRRNCVIPVVLWVAAMIAKSGQIAITSPSLGSAFFCAVVAAGSVAGGYLCVRQLYTAMIKSAEREIREVCIALLVMAGHERTTSD